MLFNMIFIGPEHDLAWIPEELPENVFMLLSTLPGRVSSICRVNIFEITVKPVFSGHCRELSKVVIIDRWPLNPGSLFHINVHLTHRYVVLSFII